MSLLTITDLSLRVGARALLDGATLSVEPGRRIGLVGRNGAGKSTLLAAICGERSVDGGDIRLASRARMAWVRQEAPEGDASLLETVLAGDVERTELLARAERAETNPDHTHELADIHERLRTIGADTAPARAGTILSGLGFDAAAQARAVREFSGGWRMRVSLATALFLNPDLLLLDEPTNHLDLEATMWLEGWLAKFPGAALVVSHDRGMLDRAVEAIAHLEGGKLSLTPGGYTEFVRIRTEHALQQAKMAEKVAAQRAHMQSFVDRFRAKASKARQAQARIKALEKLPQIDSVVEATPTRFDFPPPVALAPPVLNFDHVSVGYGDTPILRDINLSIDMEDRIALLGANGNGKSTFAKLVAGRLQPMAGSMFRNTRLRVGYFAQHQTDELVLSESPVDHMTRAMPKAVPSAVRAQLARFGLDANRAETKVGELSGGEKARLLLALATRDAPQLLILDEPTNHLDIDARDALVRALAAFEGAVLLISHDPDLVELIADRLWLVADGAVQPFEGDMDDYRGWLSERARETRAASKPANLSAQAAREDRRERAAARKQTAPLRKQVKDAETRLSRLTQERRMIEAQLADPELYATGKTAKVAALNMRLSELDKLTAVAETDWLAAEAALEEAS